MKIYTISKVKDEDPLYGIVIGVCTNEREIKNTIKRGIRECYELSSSIDIIIEPIISIICNYKATFKHDGKFAGQEEEETMLIKVKTFEV